MQYSTVQDFDLNRGCAREHADPWTGGCARGHVGSAPPGCAHEHVGQGQEGCACEHPSTMLFIAGKLLGIGVYCTRLKYDLLPSHTPGPIVLCCPLQPPLYCMLYAEKDLASTSRAHKCLGNLRGPAQPELATSENQAVTCSEIAAGCQAGLEG